MEDDKLKRIKSLIWEVYEAGLKDGANGDINVSIDRDQISKEILELFPNPQELLEADLLWCRRITERYHSLRYCLNIEDLNKRLDLYQDKLFKYEVGSRIVLNPAQKKSIYKWASKYLQNLHPNLLNQKDQ